MTEDIKKKPQGPIGRLKELATDKEEQLELLSVLVRIIVLFWSGAILSLNYVTIPNYEKDKIDPTFIASVFTGVLATFGITTASKKNDGTMKMDKGGGSGPNGSISKADMEKLIEKATQAAPAQTIRIEQAPIAITPVVPDKKKPPTA